MIEINLLPKDLKKKARGFDLKGLKKKTLYIVSAGLGIMVLLIGLTVFQSFQLKSLDSKILEAKKRTEKLKKDIQLVDALTELKDKILQRMSAIENLDRNRTAWVDILKDLSSRVPEYLWLSGFKEAPKPPSSPPPPSIAGGQTPSPGSPLNREVNVDTAKTASATGSPLPTADRKATLSGYTYSINSLARFIIQLMKSDYFRNIELNFVKAAEVEKQKVFSFELACDLIYTTELPSFAEREKTNKLAAR